jgi:hypothetical protein
VIVFIALVPCGEGASGQPIITDQPQTLAVARDKQVTFTAGMRGAPGRLVAPRGRSIKGNQK